MKIIQINVVYKKGSTGKIVYEINNELKRTNNDSIVLYGRGKKVIDSNAFKVSCEVYSKLNNLFSRFTGYMYGGCFFSTNNLIKKIKREKPDIVHLHCINGYFVNIYRLIRWLNKNDIKTIITLHAEFMFTANCSHSYDCTRWKNGCHHCQTYKQFSKSLFFDRSKKSWNKLKKSFLNFKHLSIVSVSPWLYKRAISSSILGNFYNLVILNGVDTDIFKYTSSNLLRDKYKNKKIILYVTPFFSENPLDLKGGPYILQLAKLLENDNIHFIIIGKNNNNKIYNNITFVGNIDNQRLLAEYYSTADLTVLTSKRETFSMVTVESLSCGTPVVGFCAGAPEEIANAKYSSFVEYGNINKLKKEIVKFLKKNFDKKAISIESKNIYSKEEMVYNYINLYSSMIGSDGNEGKNRIR